MKFEHTLTSRLMALIANCHRSKKHRIIQPLDFHPYADDIKRASRAAAPPGPITALKVFLPPGDPNKCP